MQVIAEKDNQKVADVFNAVISKKFHSFFIATQQIASSSRPIDFIIKKNY